MPRAQSDDTAKQTSLQVNAELHIQHGLEFQEAVQEEIDRMPLPMDETLIGMEELPHLSP